MSATWLASAKPDTSIIFIVFPFNNVLVNFSEISITHYRIGVNPVFTPITKIIVIYSFSQLYIGGSSESFLIFLAPDKKPTGLSLNLSGN